MAEITCKNLIFTADCDFCLEQKKLIRFEGDVEVFDICPDCFRQMIEAFKKWGDEPAFPLEKK